MDDLAGIGEASVRFGIFINPHNEAEIIIAISEFDGVPKVGCGATRKDAMLDLFSNAFPDKKQKFSPFAAMQLGNLEDKQR